MSDLRSSQLWMLAVCTTGQRANQASAVVRGSAALSADERMAIYSRGYVARLQGHLRARFPMLLALVGERVFDLFALAYIRARPPSSYSLFDYGADFADFLDETRPVDGGDVAALPAAVARLDQLKTRAPVTAHSLAR